MLSISRPPHTHLVQFLVHDSMAWQNSERSTGDQLQPKYLDETHEIKQTYAVIYIYFIHVICQQFAYPTINHLDHLYIHYLPLGGIEGGEHMM